MTTDLSLRSGRSGRYPAMIAAFVFFGGIMAVGVATIANGRETTLAPRAASSRTTPTTAAPTPLSRLLGQVLMGRITGTIPSKEFLARIRRGELGGVIIFPDNFTTPASLTTLTARLQQVALEGGNPPLLIATDQEGGLVKRLPDGPPKASAQAMGVRGSATSVDYEGRATGRYLRKLGINVNLAPVLDVPNSASSFLGSRAFGKDPALVGPLGAAFVAGLQRRRVAATAKHFPGLGTARGNTDTGTVVITTLRGELLRRLVPFRSSIQRGVKLVMVSNAAYPALDSTGLPAVLSPAMINGILREDLEFGGVVITDTMSAPGPSRYRDAPVRAIKAGVDVLLYSDGEAVSAGAFQQLLRAARAGTLSRARLEAANARVDKLKGWLAPPSGPITESPAG